MSQLLTYLHTLPDLTILTVVVCAITALAMMAPHLGRGLLRLRTDQVRSDAALDAFKAVMAMTGVVLAFALVQANANLKTAEMIVTREASAISAVDRVLLRSGDSDLVKLRPALEAYAKSIIDIEWPLLADSGRAEPTDDLYNALSRQARTASPQDARQQVMFAELMKLLDDLADLREQRLAEASNELPVFFWTVSVGLLLLGFGLALLVEPKLGGTVSVGATAAAVALLLAFVVIVDQPFEGETSITSKEIVKAVKLNTRR